MNVAVVFDICCDGDRAVAEAIVDRVSNRDPTVAMWLVPSDDADPEGVGHADLVILGGPARHRAWNRLLRRQCAGTRVRGPCLVDLVKDLPPTGATRAAVFDTRPAGRFTGRGARQIAREVRGRGYRVVMRPHSFFIADAAGHLAEGEWDRAAAWGAEVLSVACGGTPAEDVPGAGRREESR